MLEGRYDKYSYVPHEQLAQVLHAAAVPVRDARDAVAGAPLVRELLHQRALDAVAQR